MCWERILRALKLHGYLTDAGEICKEQKEYEHAGREAQVLLIQKRGLEFGQIIPKESDHCGTTCVNGKKCVFYGTTQKGQKVTGVGYIICRRFQHENKCRNIFSKERDCDKKFVCLGCAILSTLLSARNEKVDGILCRKHCFPPNSKGTQWEQHKHLVLDFLYTIWDNGLNMPSAVKDLIVQSDRCMLALALIKTLCGKNKFSPVEEVKQILSNRKKQACKGLRAILHPVFKALIRRISKEEGVKTFLQGWETFSEAEKDLFSKLCPDKAQPGENDSFGGGFALADVREVIPKNKRDFMQWPRFVLCIPRHEQT
jgi:hypothetical protein